MNGTYYHLELFGKSKWNPVHVELDNLTLLDGFTVYQKLSDIELLVIDNKVNLESTLVVRQNNTERVPITRIIQRDFLNGRCLAVREVCRFEGKKRIKVIDDGAVFDLVRPQKPRILQGGFRGTR
jgi:hypothetical protein